MLKLALEQSNGIVMRTDFRIKVLVLMPLVFILLFDSCKQEDQHPEQPKLITLFSWNEWVEGGYLLPDMRWGYGYLEALEKTLKTER